MHRSVINLIKSARFERAGYAPLTIFSASSFANSFNINVLILALVGFLLYLIGAVHNSVKDKDHFIRKKPAYLVMVLIFIICFAISLTNLKILILILAASLLSFFYNTASRKILMADLATMSITHIFLPFLGTLWVLNESIVNYIPYALMPSLAFFFIVNVKNMSGFQDDAKRGYVTLMTRFRNRKKLMQLSVLIGILIILFFYFILDFSAACSLILLLILIISVLIIRSIDRLDGRRAVILARFVIFLVFLIYIINNRPPFLVLLLFVFSGIVFAKEGIETSLKMSKLP
jgi:4-hydroxybenzoate polyprenyltransferase